MAYKIQEIEGIGPTYGKKLGETGVLTTEDLLKSCCDSKGRKAISERTGLTESQLLKWAKLLPWLTHQRAVDTMRPWVGRSIQRTCESSEGSSPPTRNASNT